MDFTKLTPKKPQPKKPETLTGKDVYGREKTIHFFGWDIDYVTAMMKSASSDKSVIASKHSEFSEFFRKIGFNEKRTENSASYQTGFGHSVYFGKQRGSSEQKLKIEFKGGAFVYSKARKHMRKFIRDTQELFTDKLIDTNLSRLDVSTLVYAESIHDIVPEASLNGSNVINASSLKYHPYYDDKKNPHILTGVSWSNASFVLTIYNKGIELQQKSNRDDGNYFKYYQKYLKEAVSKDLNLYRVELKVKSHPSYLSKFHRVLMNEPELIDDCLTDIMRSFCKYHQFRKVPKKFSDAEELDRRNITKWHKDEFTEMFFCGHGETKVKAYEQSIKEKYDLDFKTLPKPTQTPSEVVDMFAKRLAKINQEMTTEEFEYIEEQLRLKYQGHVDELKMTERESLIRQTNYRLYFSDNERQREMIRKDLDEKLKSLKIRNTYKIADEPRGYYDEEEEVWRQLGLYNEPLAS